MGPLLVSDFDFDLPDELIAQDARPRGDSRLLIVDRATGTWRESHITELPDILTAGDLLVVNDTRVFPARLLGRRDPSGGAAECFLLEPLGDDRWLALVHPGQKLKPGARLVFEDAARAPDVTLRAEILERRHFGRRVIQLDADGIADSDRDRGVTRAIDALGHIPLPPYIHRPDSDADRERYQTVFARERGSVAAPTAGLHFDDHLLARLDAQGVGRAAVTLHVGYGTFKPVRVDRIDDHVVDEERYEIPVETTNAIRATKAAGRRVVAVGTTTTRALESAVDADGIVRTGPGVARLFLRPESPNDSKDAPHSPADRPAAAFNVIDALLTNFHLPRSSLLMLVSAFGGRELVLAAYRDAVLRGFRFYSYGDAMLIL